MNEVAVDATTVYEDAPDSTGWVELHWHAVNEPYDKWSASGCGCSSDTQEKAEELKEDDKVSSKKLKNDIMS